ncbi:hypothetical protein ZC03_082 [Pseudomonas phage ZC03]|uniref:Uncharacterized protein n=2 Tax=Zicotriavirus TaxID=2843161 RepID=A0A1L2C980_9CAUD|nr:hypothetical protein HWA93_gp47 [Pseudomonas phage ZC03]YP_009830641.1 hypothetical protein HWA94_gp47 [Pseudomonas phage ZC08]AMD43459.1 hypothetical protein ZC03_082 [Pseudomonas phage ZC03]AMD43486.1 hypothetical protein ZC08_079 [Pseudomonas phage ZC08]
MDLEYVGMGVHVCPVCLKEHDEVVLINNHLRPTLKRRNFVGWSLCDEHEELWQKGYIALIECSNDKQPTLENAERTGAIAHVRKEAWSFIFNTPVPGTPIAFVQQGVIEQLQNMCKEIKNDN